MRSDPLSLSSRLLLTRLLPATLLLPALVGGLRYAGERAGLFGSLTGVVLMVAFTSLTLSGLVGLGAVGARRIEERDQRLQENLALFREFFNESIDMFFVANLEGYFTSSNPACSTTLGYTAEEFQTQPFLSFVHPDDRDATVREMATNSEGNDTTSFENRYRCKDGSYKTIQWQARVHLEQGLIHAVARDVTALRASEHELRESQRSESLSILAGGVAHDFNNLLVGVLGNADLLAGELADSPQGRLAQQIQVAGRRAAELTRQMLAYSGRGRFVVEPLSISHLIRDTAPLAESMIASNAKLVMACPDGLSAMQGDATQIRQVMMNLLTNASDSLDERPGTITVTVSEVEADAEYISQFVSKSALPEGRYLIVDVSDTGRGMDAAAKTRAFDPYFTTKDGGSGLGLAAVRGIVEGHGGGLLIHSEPGRGSTFKVIFPATADRVNQTVLAQARTLQQGMEVLLADDEEIVRTIAKRMLEDAGCTVTDVADGLEAVQTFERNPELFDCVVLDLMMPGYNGDEAFEHIRQIRPDIPTLICSGYSAQKLSARFASDESALFLQKPYGLDELTSALATVTRRATVVVAQH